MAARAGAQSRTAEAALTKPKYDIGVEGKITKTGPIVMIYAGAKGRKIVESLWPDVEWARDPLFAKFPPDWQFTHVRITRLAPFMAEKGVTLTNAHRDKLSYAVAWALQSFAEPRRVALFYGDGDREGVRYDDGPEGNDLPVRQALVRELFVEYVPPERTVMGSA
jgi:hypothetical protein